MLKRDIQYFQSIHTMTSSCLGNRYASSMTRALRDCRSMTGCHFVPFFTTNTCHPAGVPFASRSRPCSHCSLNAWSTNLCSSWHKMLNSKTVKNAYSLPQIQDCIDKVGRTRRLSTLDMTSRYWQVRNAEENISKTAFNTWYGKYEFLVMSFGLTNAPAIFQTLMNSIL